MSTNEDLLYRLGLDNRGFVNGLNQSQSLASGFAGKLKGILGGIAIGAAAIAGIKMVTGAISDMVQSAIPIEGIKNSFDGLTASFEGGSKAQLEALQKASYGMVKNSDLMKSFNTAAQLVSIDFAQQLPEAMQYLSKVSAATGQDMGFMVDSLVKGVGRMSPMILDNLGIQVDLATATQKAAEMFGVEASALTKTQLQAGMMNQVIEKLQVNTANMPEIVGTAAQQWESFKTTVANVKEEIGLKLLPVFARVVEGLNDWISSPEGQASVDKFIGWIDSIVGDSSSGIVGVVSKLMEGDINGAFELAFGAEPAAWLKRVSETLAAIGINLDLITGNAPGTTNVFTILKGAAKLLGIALESVLLTLQGITSLMSFLTTGTSIQPIQDKAAEFLNRTFPNLQSNIPSSVYVGGMQSGFASGGSFTVPGTGSGDRPYTMGLTPGETVSIAPRGASGGLKEIDYDRLAIIVRDAVLQVAR